MSTVRAATIEPATLNVLSVETDKRGKIKTVREYLDTSTGEVILAQQLTLPAVNVGERVTARERILESLRPEVRQFARFVLKFANKRRGVTPGIDTLCRWYADMTGKLVKNVRRYIPNLHAAGILAGENLLAPVFQRAGSTSRDSKGEEAHAVAIYSRLRLQQRQTCVPGVG